MTAGPAVLAAMMGVMTNIPAPTIIEKPGEGVVRTEEGCEEGCGGL